MAHLNLLNTIHTPVRAAGQNILNSFGIVIATAKDPVSACALAELVNLAVPAAEALNDQEEERNAAIDRTLDS